MKKIIFLLFLIPFIAKGGNNYYFSNSGSDSYTSTQAKNPSTPWKSIAKLNSFFASLSPGDSVLFKAGEVFYGAIIVGRSGSSGLPIVISSYGIGAIPVIIGTTTPSSWSSVGTNIYQTNIAVKSTFVNFIMDGIQKAMGRYPNAGTANGGFLTYNSFSGNTVITDKTLPASPNWTGAEVVIRKYRWVIERLKVSNHNGNNITYANLPAIS